VSFVKLCAFVRDIVRDIASKALDVIAYWIGLGKLPIILHYKNELPNTVKQEAP